MRVHEAQACRVIFVADGRCLLWVLSPGRSTAAWYLPRWGSTCMRPRCRFGFGQPKAGCACALWCAFAVGSVRKIDVVVWQRRVARNSGAASGIMGQPTIRKSSDERKPTFFERPFRAPLRLRGELEQPFRAPMRLRESIPIGKSQKRNPNTNHQGQAGEMCLLLLKLTIPVLFVALQCEVWPILRR